MMRAAFIFAALLVLGSPVLADEGHHPEDLTSDQLETVHVPVSCSPAAQKAFERGVALLHSFWYEEAEKTFQQVAKEDPRCAKRFDALYGAAQAAELSGKNLYYAQRVQCCHRSNSNRPELGQARAQLARKGSEIGSASQK